MIFALLVCFILLTLPASSGAHWAAKEPVWVWWWLFISALLLIVVLFLLIIGCGKARDNSNQRASCCFIAFAVFAGILVVGGIAAFAYFAASNTAKPHKTLKDKPRDNLLLIGSAVAIFVLVCVPLLLFSLSLCFAADEGQQPWRLYVFGPSARGGSAPTTDAVKAVHRGDGAADDERLPGHDRIQASGLPSAAEGDSTAQAPQWDAEVGDCANEAAALLGSGDRPREGDASELRSRH